jgi:uncharacterized membrane protein
MIVFDLSLDIERPLADVFGWWCDPSNLPKWQSGVTGVDWDGSPPAKGSRYTVHRKALGLSQDMRTTLVEFEPGVRVVEKARGGPATNTVTTTFSEVRPGLTRIETHVEVDLGGVLGRFGDKLAAGKVKSQAVGDQKKLKQCLERL